MVKLRVKIGSLGYRDGSGKRVIVNQGDIIDVPQSTADSIGLQYVDVIPTVTPIAVPVEEVVEPCLEEPFIEADPLAKPVKKRSRKTNA